MPGEGSVFSVHSRRLTYSGGPLRPKTLSPEGVLMYPIIRGYQPHGIEFQLKVQKKNTTFLINSGLAIVHVNSGDPAE